MMIVGAKMCRAIEIRVDLKLFSTIFGLKFGKQTWQIQHVSH